MLIIISGASGLIGTALTEELCSEGHTVKHLVRRVARNEDEISWDPAQHKLDAQQLEGADAVVNLSGAGVGDKRWNDDYKKLILQSRLDSANTLCDAFHDMAQPPATYIQASAVGYYGDRGDEILTEASAAGSGFLSEVCVRWESIADRAKALGIRTPLLRTGLVMSRTGGAFAQLLPLFKAGLAGPLGTGSMWWPWITLHDHVKATTYLLGTDVDGPVNLVSPGLTTNRIVTKALAAALKRPAVIPVPKPALRVALGEFANEVFASQRAEPTVLTDAGFTFDHATLAEACDWLTSTAK